MTISVEHLSRSFGAIEAVKGIDFEVGRGETFGFLGPNGAGKSTTIKMLCTLLHPSGGSTCSLARSFPRGECPAGSAWFCSSTP